MMTVYPRLMNLFRIRQFKISINRLVLVYSRALLSSFYAIFLVSIQIELELFKNIQNVLIC